MIDDKVNLPVCSAQRRRTFHGLLNLSWQSCLLVVCNSFLHWDPGTKIYRRTRQTMNISNEFGPCETQPQEFDGTECRIRAKFVMRSKNGRAMVVFKRTGSRHLINCADFMVSKKLKTKRTRLPCSEDDCKVCGVFCRRLTRQRFSVACLTAV